MRAVAMAFAFLLVASIALAGPNAGGVLWVHDTGITACTDSPVWPPKPPHCAAVDNQMPVFTSTPSGYASRFWKVYAGFPLGSCPRLKTVGWRAEFPEAASPPYSYVNITGLRCSVPNEDGPGTDVFLGELGFPTLSGGQIQQSFPTGPRLTTVTTLFIFAGYGYNYGGTYAPPVWSTVQHSAPGHRFFGDDAVPANEDPIMGYGSLGFGVPGMTPCSGWPGSCCYPDGHCQITDALQCTGVFTGAGVCDPNTCQPYEAPGACCELNGLCTFVTADDCPPASLWHGAGTLCNPNPCQDLTGSDGASPIVRRLQVLTAPNPSSGGAVIRCLLPGQTLTVAVLFDATGRMVRRLHEGDLPAGETLLSWDGRDEAGREMPAGVYLVKITTPAGETSGRVVLAK